MKITGEHSTNNAGVSISLTYSREYVATSKTGFFCPAKGVVRRLYFLSTQKQNKKTCMVANIKIFEAHPNRGSARETRATEFRDLLKKFLTLTP